MNTNCGLTLPTEQYIENNTTYVETDDCLLGVDSNAVLYVQGDPSEPIQVVELPLDLDSVFQQLISQVTGLDGQYVRPRWQSGNPVHPPAGTNWAAVGVILLTAMDFPVQVQYSDGLHQTRHEGIEVLATFYGPNAMRYAGIARDGVYVQNNHEFLEDNNIALLECSEIRQVHELYNMTWVRRYDLMIRARRNVTRIYPVGYIETAPFNFIRG